MDPLDGLTTPPKGWKTFRGWKAKGFSVRAGEKGKPFGGEFYFSPDQVVWEEDEDRFRRDHDDGDVDREFEERSGLTEYDFC